MTATFFVLGERVEQHPELFARVKAAGHEVEVHGYAHLRHPHVDESRGRSATSTGRSKLSAARRGGGFRGGISPTSRAEVARERGLEIVGWSTDTHDWRGDSAETMLDGLTLEHGGIVLAHDGISVGARRDTRARDGAAGADARREGARGGADAGSADGGLAGTDPGRESRVPSRGSAARVTALATQDALNEIAANAAELDRHPAFPHAAFRALKDAGALTPPPTRAEEWARVREVSKADGSVGRIFEGHLNALRAARNSRGSTPRIICSASGAPIPHRTRVRRQGSTATNSTGARCSAPARAVWTARS